MTVARHVRSALVLTGTQMLEVAGQLSSAGIVGDDMTSSLRVLLARAPEGLRYSEWRASLVTLRAGKTSAEAAAALVQTYGHDAVRAAHVLSRRSWS